MSFEHPANPARDEEEKKSKKRRLLADLNRMGTNQNARAKLRAMIEQLTDAPSQTPAESHKPEEPTQH